MAHRCSSRASAHSLPVQRPAVAEPRSAAAFSACGRYRWWLLRSWEPRLPRLLFLGLNPSSADHRQDDPTLRRLLGFAHGWGYGSLEVLNLFSRRSVSPALLRRCDDPVGAETDRWIRRRVRHHAIAGAPEAVLWLGWGNGGACAGRDGQVLRWLEAFARSSGTSGCRSLRLASIGLTAAGHPRHPLYAPATAQLVSIPAPAAS
jgi:hypothetical protein